MQASGQSALRHLAVPTVTGVAVDSMDNRQTIIKKKIVAKF
jgi:hypothetical protein